METWPYIATANRACSLLYSFIKEHSGGVWLLPVNVCPDVPLTFCLAKVPFLFVDINPETLCIDIDVVEHILHQSPSEYKGVLFVRTYGVLKDTSCEFEQIKSINKETFTYLYSYCYNEKNNYNNRREKYVWNCWL